MGRRRGRVRHPVRRRRGLPPRPALRPARRLRAWARLPIFLGGDHSVTASTLRAFDDVPALHVVQLDAHLDFTDVRNDTRWSNASPFRRAAEVMPNLARVTTFGRRGLRFDREAVAAARGRGHVLVPMWELDGEAAVAAALERLPRGEAVYLSLDVDALDPAIMPGTSSPEPDGMTAALARRIVEAAAARNTVVGVDLVELAPGLDPSGNSALLAARLVMDVIGAVFGCARDGARDRDRDQVGLRLHARGGAALAGGGRRPAWRGRGAGGDRDPAHPRPARGRGRARGVRRARVRSSLPRSPSRWPCA